MVERYEKQMGLALEAKLPGVERGQEHEHGERYKIVTQTQGYVKMQNGMDKVTEMVSLMR